MSFNQIVKNYEQVVMIPIRVASSDSLNILIYFFILAQTLIKTGLRSFKYDLREYYFSQLKSVVFNMMRVLYSKCIKEYNRLIIISVLTLKCNY
jgi:hypothetical protein